MLAFFKNNLRNSPWILRKISWKRRLYTLKHQEQIPVSKDRRYIYRASIKLKDGTVIYAKAYGKRAFRIPVDNIAQV